MAERFTLELYAMRSGGQAVHDGISDGGFIDELVPFGDGKLGCDDEGFAGVSVLDQLEQGQAEMLIQRLESEVVQDDQRGPFPVVELLEVGAVELGQGDLFDEAVHVEVQGPVAEHAGLVGHGAGDVALAAAGGAGDQYGLGLLDVGPLHQQGPLLFGQVPACGAFHVFGQCGKAELGQFEVVAHAFVAAVQDLGLGQGGDEFVRIELLVGGLLQLGLVEGGHAGQA